MSTVGVKGIDTVLRIPQPVNTVNVKTFWRFPAEMLSV